MENLTLKFSAFEDVNKDFIYALKDEQFHNAKLSTTKKEIILDNKDSRYIKSIKNIKMIFKMSNGGVLIAIGNLQCDFKQPMGGAFFCRKIVTETTEYESITGVDVKVRFGDLLSYTSISEIQNFMSRLVNDSSFEYNIRQFDEFMKLFEFYKKLSDELNNNITYEVSSQSKSYFFIPFDVKEFDLENKEEVTDINGVLKGYKFEDIYYAYLNNDIKQYVRELIDIHIPNDEDVLKNIRRVSDNIYLSNHSRILNEKDVKNLKQFVVVNITIDKKEIILSGELKNSIDYEEDYQYLNLYDMGQKIKIESIDNSLRLINQGATGAAAELLEYLIGDKKMPNNPSRSKVNKQKEKYMDGLNDSQRRAFLMAVDGSPVSLIKGPPGTGKTHVINAIVQYITKELKEKVVISSQTHIAIDNVLDKLVENYDLVIPNRITNRKNKYSDQEIDKTLYYTWASKFKEHNNRSSSKILSKKIEKQMALFKGEPIFKYSQETSTNDYSVIGATTTTSAIAGKKGLEVLQGFDWLIIDEVSKCPITEVLRYLPYVKRIIMVGDDFQLAPLLEFSKDEVKELSSYNEEMFEKLQNMYQQSVFAKVMSKAKDAKRLVLLNENYRSVNQVLKAYNVFYDGELIGKREEVRPNKVQFKVTENDIDYDCKDVMFVEVLGGQETRDGTSRFNLEEINATVSVLKDLLKNTINPSTVSVSAIFPYAAQISHFQRNNVKLINECKKTFKSFEIDTVDAFQGKETDIVLVNTVVTDSSQTNFLNDFRRINVSMSRAKDKLIIFGNSITLKKIKMKIGGGKERKYFKEIIDYIETSGMIIKYNGGQITHGNSRKSSIKLA